MRSAPPDEPRRRGVRDRRRRPTRLVVRLVATHLIVAMVAVSSSYLIVRWLAPTLFDESLRGAGRFRDPTRGPGGGPMLRQQFADAVANALVVGATVGAVLAAIAGVLMARQVVKPIYQLADAARDMAHGHYAVTLPRPRDRELGELAADLGALGAALAETESRRTRLLGEVAHEMRTPLTVIDGYMEGMIDGVLPATESEYAQVQAEVRRLRRLVEDLSALSRVEEGRVALRLEPADLGSIAARAAERLRAQAEDAGLTLRIDLAAPLPVRVDADRMAQVVTNLVGNAIRATPTGGTITVSGEVVGERATLQVADTGEGLARDDLERVFERFYRVPDGRGSRVDHGSGIGLTIARGLVRGHGGTLTAASLGRGAGATFTLALPLRTS